MTLNGLILQDDGETGDLCTRRVGDVKTSHL